MMTSLSRQVLDRRQEKILRVGQRHWHWASFGHLSKAGAYLAVPPSSTELLCPV